jgi:hypothetical protein
MADKKISELTSADLPLTGAELVPIVQGGVTKKVAVSEVSAEIEGQSTVLIEATLSDLGVSTFDEVTPAKLAEYTATLDIEVGLNQDIDYKISEDEPILTYLNVFEFNEGDDTTLEDMENTIGEPLIDGVKIGNTIYFNNIDYSFVLDGHSFGFIDRVVTQANIIGSVAFYGTLLTQIEAPRCTTISDSAFSDCTNLSGYDFPLLETIDENCFANCFSLDAIVFPSLTNIGPDAFSGCENAFMINLPSVMFIESGCFQGCISLEEIEMPLLEELGPSVSDNSVFDGITGQNISVTVPIALQTINGGNLEGDLQYLDDNNTVTFNWV